MYILYCQWQGIISRVLVRVYLICDKLLFCSQAIWDHGSIPKPSIELIENFLGVPLVYRFAVDCELLGMAWGSTPAASTIKFYPKINYLRQSRHGGVMLDSRNIDGHFFPT